MRNQFNKTGKRYLLNIKRKNYSQENTKKDYFLRGAYFKDHDLIKVSNKMRRGAYIQKKEF